MRPRVLRGEWAPAGPEENGSRTSVTCKIVVLVIAAVVHSVRTCTEAVVYNVYGYYSIRRNSFPKAVMFNYT